MDLQAIIASASIKHSQNVSEISGILAKYSGYPDSEAEIIRQAALFHDLGKIDIPPEILDKPGALTANEFSIIKCHTRYGRDRIKDALHVLYAACVIADNHHEKWDGSGYNGLAANAIHPYARLVSVADVFDALAQKRPYKDAWDINDILGYMKGQAGIQFDAGIVSTLLAHKNDIAALYR